MKNDNYLTDVRKQYENYPYPARDPKEELNDLYVSKGCSLDCLNHYCYQGKRDFSAGFRVLVAGGGTGDDAIYLAEQLRETDAEIVYLDMTEASMDVAKARANARKLTNIKWVHESILNISKTELGEFDFITCTGVLHHLENPEEGLKKLNSVLAESGAMYIMVYASIGRTGVYQMQALMREINAGVEDQQVCVDNTKQVLSTLPPGNWFNFNAAPFKSDLASDIGIFDLLLHTQDRAYSVLEFYEFIESDGLVINKLYNPDHPLGDMIFKPEAYLARFPELLKRVKSLPLRNQQAICELLVGQLAKQSAFVTKKETDIPDVDSLDMVPAFSVMLLNDKFKELKASFSGKDPQITINNIFNVKRATYTAALFGAIDGERSIKEIVSVAIGGAGKEDAFAVAHAQLSAFLRILIDLDLLYLKEKSVPTLITPKEIIERAKTL